MKSIYMLCNYNPAQFCKNDWNKSAVLNGYYYQKSLFTFGGEGLSFAEEEISVKNSWARGHVADDITKRYVGKILNEVSDYIFIDALGCIVPVRQITAGTVTTEVTYNRYMNEACKRLAHEKKISLGEVITDFSDADIRKYVMSFCEMLLSKYSQEQIIVHKANYAEWYDYNGNMVRVSDSIKKNRKHMSDRLNLIYQIMEIHMPEAHYIDMLPNTSSQSLNNPFNYTKQYAEYLTGMVLSIMYPNDTSKYMQRAYTAAIASNGAPPRIEGASAELVKLINDYQYRLEMLNRQIMQYDERINEACSSLTGTSYAPRVAGNDELTYETFLKLKKTYIHREKRRNNILWHIFVYPFTRLKRYFEYVHMHGFVSATRAAVSYYKNYLKNIFAIRRGEK